MLHISDDWIRRTHTQSLMGGNRRQITNELFWWIRSCLFLGICFLASVCAQNIRVIRTWMSVTKPQIVYNPNTVICIHTVYKHSRHVAYSRAVRTQRAVIVRCGHVASTHKHTNTHDNTQKEGTRPLHDNYHHFADRQIHACTHTHNTHPELSTHAVGVWVVMRC